MPQIRLVETYLLRVAEVAPPAAAKAASIQTRFTNGISFTKIRPGIHVVTLSSNSLARHFALSAVPYYKSNRGWDSGRTCKSLHKRDRGCMGLVGKEVGPVTADIVISATEIEVLTSDSLAEGLGVIAPGSEE